MSLDTIQNDVEQKVSDIFKALRIDTESSHNLRDTPRRVAKMFVHEIFSGLYIPRPKITEFPNVTNLDQIYAVGPATVRSTCAHHLAPIMGSAWIGIIPSEKIIGLSKFSRLVDWIARRPQIQEEMTVQIANELEELIKPIALAVIVRAKHLCMSWRGVCEHDTQMVTSVMRGSFRENEAARSEFLTLIQGMEY